MSFSPPSNTPAMWLQDRADGKVRRTCFTGFTGQIRCDDPAGFKAALDQIEEARASGHHLAGFISYEAGYLSEPALAPLMPPRRDVPLVWMGIFKTAQTRFIAAPPTGKPAQHNHDASIKDLQDLVPELNRATFEQKVEHIGNYIKAGDIYQANFTYRSHFSWPGNPQDLFEALTANQPVPYAAYIDTGQEVILSLSPELFFDISGDKIRARPMKGTARRGRTNLEDAALADALVQDPKERAENLMILDLMRNDLSRISRPGSVKVPRRFTVERYRTVHQMTSSVEARLEAGTSFPAIIDALFPCGSVTGAPKVRAMEIIAGMEQSPRGVYTGAIGHLAPNGDAAFNVAIRTLTLKPDTPARDHWRGSVGVGGGIVHDSTPAGEYEECQVKIAFLDTVQKEPLALIETMKVSPDGIFLLKEHLARLADSARYFGIDYDADALTRALEACARALVSNSSDKGPFRLRLQLEQDGTFALTDTPLGPPRKELKLALAPAGVNSSDIFLYHKTTRRTALDQALATEAARTGADEVLFSNELGQLTEGSRANLFLKKDDRLLTPPTSCGCLAGTLRAHLLDDPATNIAEQVLTLNDLKNADEIWLGNSVRGLERGTLI